MNVSRRAKTQILNTIKEAISANICLNTDNKFLISVPSANKHSGHIVSLKNCRMGKTHPEILTKIGELAKVGVTKPCVQRKLIHTLTKHEIDTDGEFVEEPFYYPSNETIRNKIKYEVYKNGNLKNDQDNLEEMLKNYIKDNKGNASILLRKKQNGQNKSSNPHNLKSEEEDELERIFFQENSNEKNLR